MKSLSIETLMIGVMITLLSGCTITPASMPTSPQPAQVSDAALKAEEARVQALYENEKKEPVGTMVITARGWGAPPKQYYPEGNRKLMAMRAAKLDAYRSLAERIHGLRIWGGTTIGEMVLEQDEFKVLLDAYVVGAKVLSIMAHKDGNYEAIVEIEVDRDFLYRALDKRKDLLNLPAGYGSLPKSAYEEQAMNASQSEADKVEAAKSRSHANFYFSD